MNLRGAGEAAWQLRGCVRGDSAAVRFPVLWLKGRCWAPGAAPVLGKGRVAVPGCVCSSPEPEGGILVLQKTVTSFFS